MRKMLCCVLLVPVLALAAPPLIGTADTIGGTIYDWVANGPTYRFCVNAPGNGLHVTWMYSNDTVGTQADRNMRYNYYDFSARAWNWIDPDFMLSGVNTFTERTGFGSIAADPTNGVGVISCHAGAIRPIVARDIAPGAGIFEYCDGSPTLDGYLWPPIDVGSNRTIHMACVDDASRDNIWYARCVNWCTWEAARGMSSVAPTFPTHQIAASKTSLKVCGTWVQADAFPYIGYYRTSADGGTNWTGVQSLGYPPAFGGDTMASYYITSLNPFYDGNDRLHIVVDVLPIINDTVFIAPGEIWDWCADNTPQWNRVARCNVDAHFSQSVPTNSSIMCRPQLGRDNDGNLFCVWEQFDTTNVEPATNLLRADIWIAGSADNGITWTPAQMLNAQSTASYRFPSISDIAIDGGSDDTVAVFYLEDSISGPKAGSSPVGPWSFNPMIMHKVPAHFLTGVAEGRESKLPNRIELSASPNPLAGRTTISYALPKSGEVTLAVYDASGRSLATLASGMTAAGRYSATWDAGSAARGVYFARLETGGAVVNQKLVVR